jgi:transposase
MSCLFYGDIGHEPRLEPRDEPTPDYCPNCGSPEFGLDWNTGMYECCRCGALFDGEE